MVNFYDTRIGRYIREWKSKRLFSSLVLGEVAIDFGANVGKITERMAKPGVIVYAFEPDPNAFKKLQSKFEGFENVNCLNKAVSNYSGKARIYFNDRYREDPVKWSVASTLDIEKPHVDKGNFFEVEVVDAASVIESIDKPIGLIKMDIEGEEVKVLNKLIDKGLTSRVRNIVVETHERYPSVKESTEELRKRIKALRIKNIDLDWA